MTARHARPKGWTGPTMPAPSPPVADLTQEQRAALPMDIGDWNLSPLNREVLRTTLRVSMSKALGRRTV